MRNTFTHIIMTLPLSIHPFSTLLIFCRVAGGWGLSQSLGPPFTLYYSSFRNIQYKLIRHFIKTITGEINNIGYIFTMAPVKGWDLLGSKWTVSYWILWVGSRKNERAKRSEWLWRRPNSDQSISKRQVLWDVLVGSMQWMVHRRTTGGRSLGHGHMWGAKSRLSILIKQKSYWSPYC